MIRNHIREHSLVYQLLLILGGTVVVAGGFILAVKKMQGSRESAYENTTYTEEEIEAVESKPADKLFPQPIGNETYGLRRILRYALEAHGGREALENIRTLRRIGDVQLFEDGKPDVVLGATIIYRKPDMLRYSYQIEKRSVITCFDGSNAWRQDSNSGVTREAEDLDPNNFLLLKQDLVAIRPMSETLSDLEHLKLLEDESPDGNQPYYRIEHKLDWMTEILYFNKENFLCERRDTHMSSLDGEAINIRLEYENFRYVDRLAFPFKIRVWIDDLQHNELTLESVEVNIGVLPMVFRRPD